MRCENCKYSLFPEDKIHGECRFYPPRIVDDLTEGSSFLLTKFPEVSSYDWCGKFQQKEVKDGE